MRPILDTVSTSQLGPSSLYQTSHRTSPPTPSLRACLSRYDATRRRQDDRARGRISPRDVFAFGIHATTRLANSLETLNHRGLVVCVLAGRDVSDGKPPSATFSTRLTKPSSTSTWPMASLMREYGHHHKARRTLWALRIRVSMSEIGSLIVMCCNSLYDIYGAIALLCELQAPSGQTRATAPHLLLPARLDDTRNLAIHGQFTETDAAQVEPAHIAARAATSRATVTHAHRILATRLSHDDRLFGHCVFLPNTLCRRSSPEGLAL